MNHLSYIHIHDQPEGGQIRFPPSRYPHGTIPFLVPVPIISGDSGPGISTSGATCVSAGGYTSTAGSAAGVSLYFMVTSLITDSFICSVEDLEAQAGVGEVPVSHLPDYKR